ncbi:unnamed protein product [Musa acuminata subsp. malaccensis]|uniref:(wild Malaysian banana) hypothetical protein n=1 Tax=Musa acuminata subsp. malaccensis TaxID=214687 RepID=A0A804HWF3_MUSAM|nr:unnamed protein product [Musa acuminata subsp. malaccensis]
MELPTSTDYPFKNSSNTLLCLVGGSCQDSNPLMAKIMALLEGLNTDASLQLSNIWIKSDFSAVGATLVI